MVKEVKIITGSVKPVKFGPAIVLLLSEQGMKENLLCKFIREKLNDAGLGNKASKIFTIAIKAKSVTSKVRIDEIDPSKIIEEPDIRAFFRNTDIPKLEKGLDEAVNEELMKDSVAEEKITDIEDGILKKAKYIANVGEYDRRENNYDWNIMFRADHHRNVDYIPEDLIDSINKDLKMIISENCMIVNNHVDLNDNIRQLRFVKFINEDGEYVQFVCSSLSEKEKSKDDSKPAMYFATLPQFEAATNISDKELFLSVCEKFNRYIRDILVNGDQDKLTDYEGEIHIFRSFKEVKASVSEIFEKEKAEKKLAEKAAKAKDAAEKKASKKKKSVEEKAAEEVAANESNDEEQPQEVDAFDVFPSEE